MVIDFFDIISRSHLFVGNIYEDLSFEFGDQTQVYHSCGATLMGEFWVFGGNFNDRQVFKSSISKEFYHQKISRQAK